MSKPKNKKKPKTGRKKMYAYLFSFLMISSLFTGFATMGAGSSKSVSVIVDFGNGNLYGPFNGTITGSTVGDALQGLLNSYKYDDNGLTCVYSVCNGGNSSWKVYLNGNLANMTSKISNGEIIKLVFGSISSF